MLLAEFKGKLFVNSFVLNGNTKDASDLLVNMIMSARHTSPTIYSDVFALFTQVLARIKGARVKVLHHNIFLHLFCTFTGSTGRMCYFIFTIL
jgi:hypothetical protein